MRAARASPTTTPSSSSAARSACAARTKLVVTIAISLGLWFVAEHEAHLATDAAAALRRLPRSTSARSIPLLIYLVVAGTTSAVNLTDGLDGLAAGCAAIVLLAYIGITFITGDFDLAMLAGCLVGACIGFLWFNAFPATIFMGDTGSLGLGGAIAGLAVMTKTEVLLILLGGIFVIEALSVAIQVVSFQTTRKRVFLMAPIHHHFELKGWSETKIILRFWIVASICCAIGFTIYRQSIGADVRPRAGTLPGLVPISSVGAGPFGCGRPRCALRERGEEVIGVDAGAPDGLGGA